MLHKNSALRLGRNLIQILRGASTQAPVKIKFSEDDQQRILAVLNDPVQLQRYNVPRLESLASRHRKHGPFHSLAQVLEEVPERTFVELCDGIIGKKSAPTRVKNRRQYVFPTLSTELVNSLRSAVGIHLTPTGVSWARLRRERNELDTWNYHDTTELPKKVSPVDTFRLATDIIMKIPEADVYVMEAQSGLLTAGSKPPSPFHLHQLELSAMLLTLLNTSPKHNDSFSSEAEGEAQTYPNRMFYLRSKLPARLFGTLLGNERVATNGTVRRLLDGEVDKLPCTPVQVDGGLRQRYESMTPALQDVMGQSLLLVVTFVDVCIYRNQQSLDTLQPKRSKS